MCSSNLVTAIRIALEESKVDWDAIPNHDGPTFTMISNGDVDGVFQLSGRDQRIGCISVRPRNLSEVIALQALYRPAVRKSGFRDDWRRRRLGEEAVPVRHDDITKATADTYGVLLYQEEVMDVMQANVAREPLEHLRQLIV